MLKPSYGVYKNHKMCRITRSGNKIKTKWLVPDKIKCDKLVKWIRSAVTAIGFCWYRRKLRLANRLADGSRSFKSPPHALSMRGDLKLRDPLTKSLKSQLTRSVWGGLQTLEAFRQCLRAIQFDSVLGWAVEFLYLLVFNNVFPVRKSRLSVIKSDQCKLVQNI